MTRTRPIISSAHCNQYTSQIFHLYVYLNTNKAMLQFLFEWIQNHALLSCIIAFWIYRFYEASKPFPKVKGSKVRSISSMKALRGRFVGGQETWEKGHM